MKTTITILLSLIMMVAFSQPISFSWHNPSVSSQNYISPAKNQGELSPCKIFAAVAAVEAMSHIYYNKPFPISLSGIDLAERELYSWCSGFGGPLGSANIEESLNYIDINGLINESCFPYPTAQPYYTDCSTMCSTPGFEVNIPGFEQLNLTTPQALKRAIIDYGPIATFLSNSGYELHESVNDENHAVLIIGWDGSQWHLKDSWPNQQGITYKSINVFDSQFNAQFFRVKYENNGSVISCSGSGCSSVFSERTPTDNDHDGFWNWGIGPKPAGCTGPCKMDFNDNDITKIFLNTDYVEVNTPTVTGPDLVCTNGTIAERTFNLNNLPAGFTVTWNVSEPTYFNSPTNGSGISATISPKSQYSGDELYITFTISDGCGSAQYRKYFTINGPADSKIDINVVPSNAPTPIRVSGVWLLCPNSTYYLYCNNTSGCSTTNYQWTIPTGWTKYEQSVNYIRINTNSTPFGTVNVNATTCCGTNHLIVTRNFSQGGPCSYFSVYPNPATTEFNIGFVEEFDIETLDETSTIEIYDAGFTKKYKAHKIEKNIKVKTDDWKEGIYYVIFSYKGQKYYEKVKIGR